MTRKPRNAAKTKRAIVEAARRLFARRDIAAVSIRDIAAAAGVSHGLIEQYFGTRKRLVAAVVRSEVEDFAERLRLEPEGGAERVLAQVRRTLKAGRGRFHDYAVLITRAQLAGVRPETMLDPATPTPAMALARAIGDLQAHVPPEDQRLDPFLVSAYINAALFAFEAISPWLMAAVGLKAEDYVARHDEIVDICVQLIARASGLDAEPRNPYGKGGTRRAGRQRGRPGSGGTDGARRRV